MIKEMRQSRTMLISTQNWIQLRFFRFFLDPKNSNLMSVNFFLLEKYRLYLTRCKALIRKLIYQVIYDKNGDQKQRMREIQCAINLLEKIDPFLEKGEEKKMLQQLEQEAQELAESGFGPQLLNAIGFIYDNRASKWLSRERGNYGQVLIAKRKFINILTFCK